MILKQLSVQNFRNFGKRSFTINPFLSVIVGENSSGKTNLLEAIYAIIHGLGFRETKEEELINFDVKSDTAQVEGIFGEADTKNVFKLILVNRGGVISKSFFVDKTKKGLHSYRREQTQAVLFSPLHLEIVTGSPSIRRDYFNRVLSAYDYEYKKRLSDYEKALRRRNKLLETYENIQNLHKELDFWDGYLEEQATYLTKKREEYIGFLNSHPEVDYYKFRVAYAKNAFTKVRAKERLDLDLRIRRTTIGPQKDDYVILFTKDRDQELDVHLYGSRSQQRLAVLWLKMNEIYYCEEELKIRPILLLDDIFSELDVKNKKLVVDLVKKYQTVMTTTELEVLDLIEAPSTPIKV